MIAPTQQTQNLQFFDSLTQAVRNSLRYMVIMALEYILVNVLHM